MAVKGQSRSSTIDIDVVVVGGGPAGLAVAGCLKRAAVPHELLEREETAAPAWKKHYDRLHLHTSRAFSALPNAPLPRSYPRYASRDEVVEYFERYVQNQGLTPRFKTEVKKVGREGNRWLIETTRGVYRCSSVVIATGANGRPNIPAWAEHADFPGAVLHSSQYRSGHSFAGKDVLVVGFGNSGGEIALDLSEHGARPVVSVRAPVNVVPRDVFGMPILAIAIPLSHLPPRLADALVWPVLRLHYPSYRRLGLRRASVGPFQQIAQHHRIPLLDIGTIRAIRRGRIAVQGDVTRIEHEAVTFAGGETRRFDAIVLATGYRPSVPLGLEVPPDGRVEGDVPGLYFCGFYISPTGMLREIGKEARRIVARIVDGASNGRG